MITPFIDITSNKEELKKLLLSYERIAIGFSGGLDSTVLLAFAISVLGEKNCMALTAITPYMMHAEVDEAKRFCLKRGIEHSCLRLPIPESIANNPEQRCYFCKKELFTQLKEVARRSGYSHIADGTNIDDSTDYRPGAQAATELGVLSPLNKAGMGKAAIKQLAIELNLAPSLVNKPAYACLLTRLEHNKPFSENDLYRIDAAESYLRERGFIACRVRVHGELARIEMPCSQWQNFLFGGIAWQTEKHFKELGFRFVTLDMTGYTKGSMNPLHTKLPAPTSITP